MDKKVSKITPNQIRWKPLPFPTQDSPKNFIEGMITSSGCGHPSLKVSLKHLFYLLINKYRVDLPFIYILLILQ